MNAQDFFNQGIGRGVPKVEIHGIKIVGAERSIFSPETTFIFENGWAITINPGRLYSVGGPDAVARALVREVELRLKFLDPMILEAFRAPEVIADEDSGEDDGEGLFCPSCRGYHGG